MDASQTQPPEKPYLYPQVEELRAEAPPPYPTQQDHELQQGSDQPPPQPYPMPITTEPQSQVVIDTGALINSHHPMNIDCPHCKTLVTTKVTHDIGGMNHLIAGLSCPICWFTLLPCCLIPYCIRSFKDTKHECPECNRTLGTVKRLR